MKKDVKKGRFFVIGVIALAFLVISSFTGIIEFVTNYLWFKELGYTETFFIKIKAQISIGLPIFIILTILLYIFIKRLKKKYDEESEVVKINKKSDLIIKLISAGVSLYISLNITSTMWFQILQYINSESFGIMDPIFNNDVGFYIFKLPLINTILGAVISILFLLTAVLLLFNGYLAMRDSFKKLNEEFQDIQQFPRQHLDLNKILNKKFAERIISQLSIIGALLFLLLGVRYFLRSYDLLYSQLGRVFGAGYTDINITLNLYRILAVGSVFASGAFFIGARKGNLKTALAVPSALIIISIIGTGLAAGIEKFVVEPDQLSKETLYMQYSIKSTQKAYALDDVDTIQFPANENLTIEDLENNPQVMDNIRINDQEPLIQVYNQLQGIRPYYVFHDVDVDRYVIDGVYKQVFLSARELDQDRLNVQARTWVNQYLKYTHGYGITVSTVNNVTPQGQPEMLVRNIPPTTETDFYIQRPEIYFGEKTNNYIIVNTDETEFDYPSGADNVETLYEGQAGIKLSFFNRLLFSIREGSYRMLISNNIDRDSRIIINRNIIDRVREIAPFLYFDPDAYIVANQDDGKLYWIIEGFTLSDKFPYSQPTGILFDNWNVNYMRNSVKVVVDAYDGTIDFYAADESDPLIKVCGKIFTDLLKPISEMPEGLRKHIRYSQTFFDVQSDMYRLYHIENTTVFFGREDYWDLANEKYMGGGEVPAGSSYLMFKLPGEDSVEFLLTTQYTPQNKDNMIALLAARNDGENYGQLVLYEFPKTKVIAGPNMIETKIDQDTSISSQLTLWSQMGSDVLRGNTVVIPIEESLLYVEPIYLRSDTDSNFPEMKMVVVSYGDKILMEPTLDGAIERLFGISQQRPERPGESDTEYDDTNIKDLINKANQVFNDANEASQKGNWAEYGRKIDELERVLNQLKALTNRDQEEETVQE